MKSRMRRPILALLLALVATPVLAAPVLADERAPSIPSLDAPELAALGAYAVGVRSITLVQPDQDDPIKGGRADRVLPVEIWYPAKPKPGARPVVYSAALPGEPPRPPAVFTVPGVAVRDAAEVAGGFPLVILSHGYSNAPEAMSWLGENLASKGYVVAAIHHNDPDIADRAGFPGPMLRRPLDIAFVARTLQDRARAHAPGLSSADPDRLALIGYSMGGYGVLTVAGAGLEADWARSNVRTVNASASSGNLSLTLDGTKTSYSGGSGVDHLTLVQSLAKDLSLKAGDDSLDLSAVRSLPTYIHVDGGTGNDSLHISAELAGNASPGQFRNFEKLTLDGHTDKTVTANAFGNLTEISVASDVILSDLPQSLQTLHLDTSGSGENSWPDISGLKTVTIAGDAGLDIHGTGSALSLLDASGITGKDMGLALYHSGFNARNLTIKGSATANNNIQLNMYQGDLTYTGGSGDDDITVDYLKKVQGYLPQVRIDLGDGHNTFYTSTGNVSIYVKGGSGPDTVSFSDEGKHVIDLGSGDDRISPTMCDVRTDRIDTILSAHPGLQIRLPSPGGWSTLPVGSFTKQKLDTSQDFSLVACLDTALHNASITTGSGNVSWFQLWGDTYLVQINNNPATHTHFVYWDFVIKIAGLYDLEHSSFNPDKNLLTLG